MPILYFAGAGMIYLYGRYAESTRQLEEFSLSKTPGLSPVQIANWGFAIGLGYVVYKGLKK